MKKLRFASGVVVIGAAAVGLVAYRHSDASAAPTYRFAAVESGNVQSTVAATGTLSADTTVQVGTQVSGRIVALYADFNDHVKSGQLLARIDTVPAQQAIDNAEAGLRRAQATLDQDSTDYVQELGMFQNRVVTLTEFATAKSAYEVAKANLTSAQVALNQAEQDLGYTKIYSPIDGIIVERDVNIGQTVAASFSAPQLFLMANDLSNMQILASVDESDIGLIKAGQPVQFTVQAYPNRTFTGVVKQVRLQSTTTDNVVNYTAVVSVKNQDGALLPGMTATVNFQTGSASNVLTVPNAALRFQPPPEVLAQLRAKFDSARKAGGGTTQAGVARDAGAGAPGAPGGQGGGFAGNFAAGDRGGARAPGGGRGGRGAAPRQRPDFGALWYLQNGELHMARVRTGITDGQRTEVTSPQIKPGMQIIIGQALADQPQAAASSSPFQQQRGRGGPGGFGRGF